MMSIKKKARVRAARCLDQLEDLRHACASDEEVKGLDVVIAAFREAARSIDAAFIECAPVKRTAKKKDDDVVILYPSNLPAATPAPGRVEAQPKPFTQVVRNLVVDEAPEMLPANMNDAEWVAAAVAGKVGGVSTGEAAQRLLADTESWAIMDDEERVKAIKALAEKIDAEHDEVDGVKF